MTLLHGGGEEQIAQAEATMVQVGDREAVHCVPLNINLDLNSTATLLQLFLNGTLFLEMP